MEELNFSMTNESLRRESSSYRKYLCVKICLESVSVSVSVSVAEWVRKVFRNHYANANGYGKPSDTICTLYPSSAYGRENLALTFNICV